MIPDDVIQEVRDRADIVGVVGESITLKKSGREFKARCPFHEERTPSFYVVPAKGFYKCFGCGKSGSVFDFVMEQQGMDFVEAVKYVAGKSGVEVRETRGMKPEEDPNRHFYEITAFAQSWFREQFLDERVGAPARAYLEGRGIGLDIAERFGVGFAPDEWRAFRGAAAKHGFDEGDMEELGLLKQSDNSREPYDGFRGRVMFPIEAMNGKTVAFGGRILEGDGPKYINSTESPIFHKGRTLYGLSWAKNVIRREESALVVEGYMDVVALAAHGFDNAVAPLGTALTPDQAHLLSRYCTQVFLLFDSDAAGLRATFKAGDVLLEAGVRPSVVTLPDGEDPDTLVRTQGSDALRGLMDDAIDILERKIQILENKNYFASIPGRLGAVDRLIPTMAAPLDATLRDLYADRVAEVTGVRRETLENDVRGVRSANQERSEPRQERASAGASHRSEGAGRAGTPGVMSQMGPERQLLKVMVRGVDWVERAAELIAAEDFDDPHHRAIFLALLDDPELRAPTVSMDRLTAKRFEEILADPEELSHVFTKSVTRMRVRALDRRIQDVQRSIEAAEDKDEKLQLAQTKSRLAAEKRELDSNYWTSAKRRPVDQNSNEPNR
jgi:DNA primase